MLTLEEQLGQVLIVGVDGDHWDKSTEEFLGEVRPGGVIFFQRNIKTAPEFLQLVARVRDFLDPHPFLALDLEGGRVDRLRDILAPLPPANDVARAGLGEELGRIAGRELAAFSLNVDFAPVLDLGTPESRPVMGSRTAGDSPREVIRFAQSFLKGLGESGIAGCGKHFPGLGSGRVDSHLQLPVVEKNEREMWEQDLEPFRALASILPMIMVAHVCCPGLEKAYAAGDRSASERLPATLSHGIVSGLLKERIEYQGLVLCDDLEMGGVLEGRSMEQAAAGALQAGCDILLLCGSTANTRKVFGAMLQEAGSNPAFRARVEQAAQKVLLSKTKLGITTNQRRDRQGAATQSRAATEPPDFETLRREITDFSAAVRQKLEAQSPAAPEEGSTR